MRLPIRLIPILLLSGAFDLAAQPEQTTAEPPRPAQVETRSPSPTTPMLEEPFSRFDLKDRLRRALYQESWSLARVLSLEPSLVTNDAYVAQYPALASFVEEYPEVRQNPDFYLAGLVASGPSRSQLDGFLEGLMIFLVFVVIAFALAWLVRTWIEQKRWSRLSRTQTEVHNKILDRFTATDELLGYIRTPAGAKFLESAPIPLREAPVQDAPVVRFLWSIQIGLVVAAGALGMLLVSSRFEQEAAQTLFGMGVIGLCLGAGFVGSAVVSIVISRRLGLLLPAEATSADDFASTGRTE